MVKESISSKISIKIVLYDKTFGIPTRRKYKTAQEGYVLNPDNIDFSQVKACWK